jgi:hypothetical protein
VEDGVLQKASSGPRNQVFVARQVLDVITADIGVEQ